MRLPQCDDFPRLTALQPFRSITSVTPAPTAAFAGQKNASVRLLFVLEIPWCSRQYRENIPLL